jgi:RNA polymerase sigma factor (TIGR02999 family)
VADGEVTALLKRMAAQSGDARRASYDAVLALVYDDLRTRARQQLRGERAGDVQATTLVHQAYQRLLRYRMSFEDRRHFFNVAATAMRRILVEKARRRKALRRGAGRLDTTSDVESAVVRAIAQDPDLVLDVDRALQRLAPAQVQLVELRFFAGFTLEESADALGVQLDTLKKRWRVVKALLIADLVRWRRR